MQRVTVLPLHGGKAPRWLFTRMVKLGGLIADSVIEEYGPNELVKRLADPYWLQALSNAIGYDWHSSGSTTVTVGALKEALNYNSDIFIAGGKGKEGTDTPNQITKGVDYLSLNGRNDEFGETSRLVAKTDSALVYDDIGIYHHAFIMSRGGDWAVVQQAMHNRSNSAIRFQVHSRMVDEKDITNETNTSVRANQKIGQSTMDLTFAMNKDVKVASLVAVKEDVGEVLEMAGKPYVLPNRHEIIPSDITKRGRQLLMAASELQPESFEELLRIKGVGRKTLRSLAIISSLIYDKQVYERDPTLYAYNLGGKDGIPYRINLNDYDNVVASMKELVGQLKLEKEEKEHALRRLNNSLMANLSSPGRRVFP